MRRTCLSARGIYEAVAQLDVDERDDDGADEAVRSTRLDLLASDSIIIVSSFSSSSSSFCCLFCCLRFVLR